MKFSSAVERHSLDHMIVFGDGIIKPGHSQQSVSEAGKVIKRAVFSARGSCGSSV